MKRFKNYFGQMCMRVIMRTSQKVANYWDAHVGKHIDSFSHWEANAPVMRHQNFRISGDMEVNPISWFWRKYGPFRCMASIGSGNGILERHVCCLKEPQSSIVGYDISPGSIKIAEDNCKDLPNVKFEVADMNKKEWQHNCFDAVFAHGALHHIESLDWLLGQIRNALTPEGLLYVNDYVGPQRFQWSDVQMRLADELLNSIPQKWVKKRKVVRCDPELLREKDPSEAILSHFIADTIRAHFHIVERIPRGGTLLAPIFGSGCLDIGILKSAEGLECIAQMAKKETDLIDVGVIPSDHVVIIAKKRNTQEKT